LPPFSIFFGVVMGQFIARGVKPSLHKTGFGFLGLKDSSWKGLFVFFDEVAQRKGTDPTKPFPKYVVDKNATLFPNGKNSWCVSNNIILFWCDVHNIHV
jgi:hypothetical protein